MIASLRGQVLQVTARYALIEVAGVGYRVNAPPSVLNRLSRGEEAFVYTYDLVREDARELYGFLTAEELELFERLLNVSGVGPKVAMTVLALGSADTARAAIMRGDVDLLTSVPGVGRKTAQKIVLELKGQLVEAGEVSSMDAEVIQGLQGLGYSAQDAREALKHVSDEVQTMQERLREALKLLAR